MHSLGKVLSLIPLGILRREKYNITCALYKASRWSHTTTSPSGADGAFWSNKVSTISLARQLASFSAPSVGQRSPLFPKEGAKDMLPKSVYTVRDPTGSRIEFADNLLVYIIRIYSEAQSYGLTHAVPHLS